MNIGVTIECRMNSSRLPGKVLMEVLGKPLLLHMIERIQASRKIQSIVVATTESKKDDPIEVLCTSHGISCFRGSEENVLQRVVRAATQNSIDLLVPLGADCPLIDPLLIDEIVECALREPSYRVFDNGGAYGYPLGLDFHAVWVEDLIVADNEASSPEEREHTTHFLKVHPDRFPKYEIHAPQSLRDDVRLTMDEREDFILIQKIFEALYVNNAVFSLEQILELIRVHPDLKNINQHIQQRSV